MNFQYHVNVGKAPNRHMSLEEIGLNFCFCGRILELVYLQTSVSVDQLYLVTLYDMILSTLQNLSRYIPSRKVYLAPVLFYYFFGGGGLVGWVVVCLFVGHRVSGGERDNRERV